MRPPLTTAMLSAPGDGGEPVGDDDDRFVRHQPGHGLLDDRFVFRVDVGGGLIQNDNGGVLQYGPGDGNALFLLLVREN